MKPLTRGRIAAIDGTFGVGDLEDVTGQNTLNGSPSHATNILDRGTLATGDRYAAGAMARRLEDRVDVPRISQDGTVSLDHEDQVIAEYSKFAMIPGKFAIAWDDWAFKHLMFNFPVHDWREQSIWLNAFYDENDFHNIGSVGFTARQDNAEKGTVHGTSVTDDSAIGHDLQSGSYLNELRFTYDTDSHAIWKAYIAASGYVEVYEPSDLTTEGYLSWISEHVWPHCEETDDENENDPA